MHATKHTMALTHLCFVLPTDADEDIEPPSLADRASKHPQTDIRRSRIGSLIRRSLQCLRSGRWPRPCRCFSYKPSICHQDSCDHFRDAPGISQDDLDKKAASGTTNPRIFSYAELYIGTNGFSDKEVLGSGGFGRVYRALLPSDGTIVAVKCVAESGDRFDKSFAAELVAVAQLRHRNLVRLRGWCAHDSQLLLVYDYMPNHSLDRLLFAPAASSAAAPPLPWEWRQRVVSGLAAALFYLHEQLDTQIIHRDVKASNVMLDSGYNARLGDFGLARWLEHSQLDTSLGSSASVNESTYQFRLSDASRIGGTIGYLPPESFQRKGSATAKSDVFSFGIVALEVATGRRAVDLAYPDDQIILLDWVRRLSDEGKWSNAGDRKLQDGSYPPSEMRRLIHLGLLCSLHNPQSRPTMKWVTEALSGAGDLPALPSFQFHPLYISLSSSSSTSTSSTTRTATFASSDFLTATSSTVFLTADNGGSSDANNRRRSFKSFPIVDTPREIPYSEIVAITNNFDEAKMVAELDFGTGYRGHLDNRIHVLVKRLGMKTCPALRARFSNELLNLGRLRHRNLVQLRGWCTEQGEMLVVYDYSSSGLLSHHLFHHKSNSALAWHHRYRIVKALASAVLYLHEEWDEQVIHRNITSSAVFLDPDMNPRLGSFALAEFLSRNEHGHHVASLKSSSARGIFGYMSPEYMESGDAKTTTDVYSFGVVMLEVASGLMAVDLRWPEVLLVNRVHRFEESMRPLEELSDRRLDGRFDRRELVRLVELGIACTRPDPDSRPSMRQIVSILDGNDELLKMLMNKRKGRQGWEGKNDSSLYLIGRRMKALGIQ